MPHAPLLRLTAAALLYGANTLVMADGVSHVMSYSRAYAPNDAHEQIKENVPYWASPDINALSTHAQAAGVDSWGSAVAAKANAQARADYSWVGVQARGDIDGLDPFGRPGAAMGNAQAGAILQLDWTVTGASGVFGSIQVAGGLTAHVFGDTSVYGGGGSASLTAQLFKDACAGPGCSDSLQFGLTRNSDNPSSATSPYLSRNYTLSVDVKPGDHVYLQYIMYVQAGGGFSAGAGTAPDLAMPGSARGASAEGAALQTPSFAQIIRLSNGLGLSGTDGLTLLADGSYGFGEVSAVPEPGPWALMLAGLALLGRRLRTRAAGRVA